MIYLNICPVVIYTRSDNYDLSDHMPCFNIYEIPEKMLESIQKLRPIRLNSCINEFVCAVSLIPVREICPLQNSSESMSSFLETI